MTEHNNNEYVGALDTAVDDVQMLPTPADAAQELSQEPTDRGEVIAADGRTAAAWALRFIIATLVVTPLGERALADRLGLRPADLAPAT